MTRRASSCLKISFMVDVDAAEALSHQTATGSPPLSELPDPGGTLSRRFAATVDALGGSLRAGPCGGGAGDTEIYLERKVES